MDGSPKTRAVRTLLLSIVLAGCASTAGGPPAATPITAADRSAPAAVGQAAALSVVVYRSPTCACCSEHEAYLREAGVEVQAVVDPDIERVKKSFGIPREMYSCHTAEIAGYFVEGHVPLAAIEKLVAEKPDLDGIALPGMPPGAPGMAGVQEGALEVFAIRDGKVVGLFGEH